MTQVYWNLHRQCWSLRERGRVTGYATQARILGAEFKVQEGGRQRVLRERRKNIHAFVQGEVVEVDSKSLEPYTPGRRVRYDPYSGPHFTEAETGRPVLRAGTVELLGDRTVLAWDLEYATPGAA